MTILKMTPAKKSSKKCKVKLILHTSGKKRMPKLRKYLLMLRNLLVKKEFLKLIALELTQMF